MTLKDLLDHLAPLPKEHALIFETAAGPIGAGYHITELKHARVTSIDCGTRISSWDEAALQLLDGSGDAPLTVGKAAAILSQSIARVAGLGNSQLHVEFAHGNQGLRLYQPGALRGEKNAVILQLVETTAQCKPAADLACCSPTPAASQCCA